MNAAEVARILDAKIICGEDRLNDVEFDSAFGSDMMSDVLAYVKPTTLLLTGMVNPHVIRTAEMLDIKGIVVVRGKSVPEELVEEAEEELTMLDFILTTIRCMLRLMRLSPMRFHTLSLSLLYLGWVVMRSRQSCMTTNLEPQKKTFWDYFKKDN